MDEYDTTPLDPERLFTIDDIRAIEQSAKARFPQRHLMQSAGEAVAQLAQQIAQTSYPELARPLRVLVLAGPGDNGGDALEAASQLAQSSWQVNVLAFGTPETASQDSQISWQHAHEQTISLITLSQFESALSQSDIIIDGLFGIGLKRPLTSPYVELVEKINIHCALTPKPVIAIDLPSGLDADTGQIQGDSALCATHTLSLIANKIGLHTAKGKELAGQIKIANLGAVQGDLRITSPAKVQLLNAKRAQSFTQKRQHDSHKGCYGDVVIIGGETGMQGAILLAGRAALYAGAGRVFLGFLSEHVVFDDLHPELMCRHAEQIDLSNKVVVIGPGLGSSDNAYAHLKRSLLSCPQLLLDADALNLLAKDTELQTLCKERAKRSWQTLITPHPLEAARLLHCARDQIQANRLHAACQLAQDFQSVVLLKGSGSIISTPQNASYINSSGNPALATAGSGDVLSGLCGALMATRSALEAVCLGCYLHGAAADQLVREGIGPIGLSASELIPAIRHQLNTLTY